MPANLSKFGNFDVESKVLDKITDKNLIMIIDKIDNLMTKKAYKSTIVECMKAQDKCKSNEDKTYFAYVAALALYYNCDDDDCIRFIEENMEDFKKTFSFASTELWRIYTMLWNCQFRKKRYVEAIGTLCSFKYLSGVLQFLCYLFILMIPVYKLSFGVYYLQGSYLSAVASVVINILFSALIVFFFNGAFSIRKRPI